MSEPGKMKGLAPCWAAGGFQLSALALLLPPLGGEV